jgi:DNA-binding MarR family transcriptional regulator
MQATVKADTARGRDGERLAPLELAAWRGLLQAHADLTREMDAELRGRHGISLSAYELLMLLGDAPRRRLRVSELSAATLLTLSGVSRMVDRLARDGLVTREPCEEDGRGAEVALTPMGRGRLRAARASHLADVRRRFLSRFGDDELEQMAGFWRRLGAEGTPAEREVAIGGRAPDNPPAAPRPASRPS